MTELPRDLTGALVPPGRIRKDYTDPLTGGPGPWWQVSSGTGSALGVGPWYYRISNTSGGLLQLRTAFEIDLGLMEWVELRVDGLHVNSATTLAPGLAFKDAASTRGVGVWHPPGEATARFRAFGAGTPDRPVPVTWNGVEAGRRRTVGLAFRPKTGDVYVLAGDQVDWHHTEPAPVLGRVRAVVESTQAAGVTTGQLLMAQVHLTAWHN